MRVAGNSVVNGAPIMGSLENKKTRSNGILEGFGESRLRRKSYTVLNKKEIGV